MCGNEKFLLQTAHHVWIVAVLLCWYLFLEYEKTFL